MLVLELYSFETASVAHQVCWVYLQSYLKQLKNHQLKLYQPKTALASSRRSVPLVLTASSSLLLPGLLILHQSLLFDHVDDFVRNSQILDGAAADIALGHPPELVAVPRRANHLSQVDVHPVIAAHQVTVVRFTVF